MTTFHHIPVLAAEVLQALAPAPGGIYLDGTLGGAGHAAMLLEASGPDGFLLGIDQDATALAAAAERLSAYPGRYVLKKGNFVDLATLAAEAGIAAVDGILLDIGVSSHQLDEAERGFSYMQDAPLDMRMDRSRSYSAKDLLNQATEAELSHILYTYGEEKWAARIAKFIVAARQEKELSRTGELVDIIKRAIPAAAREKDQHPAKRSFQAFRIAVNEELRVLEQGIEAAIPLLKPGGKLAIITFHSLEDRIVKEKFRLHATDCICPPQLPICSCGHKADLKLWNRKPITASASEREANPRSRSANLRVGVKLG